MVNLLEYAIDDQVVELLSTTTGKGNSRSEDAIRHFTANEPMVEPESFSSFKSNVIRDQGKPSSNESIVVVANNKSSEVNLGAILSEGHDVTMEDTLNNTVNQRDHSEEELTSSMRSNWTCAEPPPSYQSYLRVQPLLQTRRAYFSLSNAMTWRLRDEYLRSTLT